MALQIQGSVLGMGLLYSPWTMTPNLKMPVRIENQEMNCKLLEEIGKITLHLNKRNSPQNAVISFAFTLNGSPKIEDAPEK